MITGDLKSKVDKLWTTFWSNGVINPLSVIEQISCLLFIKRLDDLELVKEKQAKRLGARLKTRLLRQSIRIVGGRSLRIRMLTIVRDKAFPFIKAMGTAGGTYAVHMKDAMFLIANAALLANVVEQIDGMPMEDRDTKGDLYEYMLSKLTTAGTNGQFRTPRHIIKMMVELMAPTAREVVCDPACGTGGRMRCGFMMCRRMGCRWMISGSLWSEMIFLIFCGGGTIVIR